MTSWKKNKRPCPPLLPQLLVVSELVGVHVAWEFYDLIVVLSTDVPAGTHTLCRAVELNLELCELSSTLGWSLHLLYLVTGVLLRELHQ